MQFPSAPNSNEGFQLNAVPNVLTSKAEELQSRTMESTYLNHEHLKDEMNPKRL